MGHRSTLRLLLLAITAVIVVAGLGLIITPGRVTDTAPVSNDGAPWRLAYYEGGAYEEYPRHLLPIIDGLATLGWLEPLDIPRFAPDDAASIWAYLAENARSDYLEFVADGFWSADWNDDQRAANRQDITVRLQAGDFDLVIAMGTWAGQDLATDAHDTPVVVVNSSDAVAAGIIHSAADSGRDHVHAWVDPNTYLRQLRLFHTFTGFQTLGLIYEDSPEGRIYATRSDVYTAAEELGFDVVECTAPDSNLPEGAAFAEALACVEEIAPQIDALWISAHRGFDVANLPNMMPTLLAHNVATWSQIGEPDVEAGVLISTARRDLIGLGQWTAEIIALILHGVSPRSLGQVYEVPSALAINMETARRIGYTPPESLMQIADVIFETIPTPSR